MVAGALMLCIALGHLLAVPMRAPVTGEVSRALDALPRGTGTQLAVDGRAVGWVQWAHPDRLPMRDLRAEVYSVPTALAYEDFQEARPGWQRYAATHHVGAVLAERERALDHALSTEPGWTVAAEDPDFRLWVHK